MTNKYSGLQTLRNLKSFNLTSHFELRLRSGLILLYIAIASIIKFPVSAQSTFKDIRKPTSLWQSESTGRYFDSQAEAFEDSKKGIEATPDWDVVVGNDLAPCTSGNDYRWGVAYLWCASVVTYYKGTSTVYGSGTTMVVLATAPCPIDYEASNDYFPPTDGVNAEYFRPVCTKDKPYHNKRECGVGNPLLPNRRAKLQTEVDFKGRGSALELVRNYYSPDGVFSLGYDVEFLAPVAEAVSSCVADYIMVNGAKSFVALRQSTRCPMVLSALL